MGNKMPRKMTNQARSLVALAALLSCTNSRATSASEALPPTRLPELVLEAAGLKSSFPKPPISGPYQVMDYFAVKPASGNVPDDTYRFIGVFRAEEHNTPEFQPSKIGVRVVDDPSITGDKELTLAARVWFAQRTNFEPQVQTLKGIPYQQLRDAATHGTEIPISIDQVQGSAGYGSTVNFTVRRVNVDDPPTVSLAVGASGGITYVPYGVISGSYTVSVYAYPNTQKKPTDKISPAEYTKLGDFVINNAGCHFAASGLTFALPGSGSDDVQLIVRSKFPGHSDFEAYVETLLYVRRSELVAAARGSNAVPIAFRVDQLGSGFALTLDVKPVIGP